MKSRNKPAEFQTFKTTEFRPDKNEKIIRISLQDAEEGNPLQVIDQDAISMSAQFPEEPIITVYQNGAPVTMSVRDLITDTLISVLARVE